MEEKEALKILIVEDQLLIAKNLEAQLLEMDYCITDVVMDATEAIRAFKKRIPDIVLMDIMLNDSDMDGIEIAHQFNQIARVPIVYLTSLKNKNTRDRAKLTNPAYYLIKPWNTLQLEIALEFAFFNFTKKKEAEITDSIYATQGPGQFFLPYKDAFFVKTKHNKLEKVLMSELLFVKGAKESVEIFTSKRRYFHSANLKSFLSQVTHPNIIRVHRSYIVNCSKIEAIHDGSLIIKNTSVPIGPSYKSLLGQVLLKLKAD